MADQNSSSSRTNSANTNLSVEKSKGDVLAAAGSRVCLCIPFFPNLVLYITHLR